MKKSTNLKIKICVSGAAETKHCGANASEKAKQLGREIVRQGAILITGATTGFPFWVTMGAKEKRGTVIGFSPAISEKEHIKKYHLPTAYLDFIIFTGSGYAGRNLQLTRSSDAVIVGCGRIGTLNEFTIAFEENKPIGILQGDWQTDELIEKIIKECHRGPGKIVYDSDPKKLVKKVIKLVQC
jgi:uncharacterized protein (TIGR00725 family)